MPKRKTRASKVDDEEEEHKTEGSTKQKQDGESEDGITHFTVPLNDKSIACERHQPDDSDSISPPSLIFTHGAGGGITAPATRDFAVGFGSVSPVVCYEGNMNLTNRIKRFHAVIEQAVPGSKIALGGRSMGARAAVLTAFESETPPDALVLVSYPLMAGSKGEKREPERREQILLDLPETVDVLFIGGDRDAQCDLEQLAELRGRMKAKSWLVEVKGADHGMELKGKAKAGGRDMRLKIGEVAAEWLKERSEEKRYCSLEWNQEKEKIVSSGWQQVAQEPAAKKKKIEAEED